MSIDSTMLVMIGLTVISAATPLVFAAIGELVVEKSGVLNLGVEGMMLAGAVSGFSVAHLTGSALFGVLTHFWYWFECTTGTTFDRCCL